MIVVEIVHPSDKYTVEAPDFRTACVAILTLGEGWYGARHEDNVMPILAVCGEGDIEQWFDDTFGECMQSVTKSVSPLAVADCLCSIVLGDREAYELAAGFINVNILHSFRDEWNSRTTSDICKRARDLADKLLAGAVAVC